MFPSMANIVTVCTS